MGNRSYHLACAMLLCSALSTSGPVDAQSIYFVRVVGVPDTLTCAPDGVIATGGTFALTWNVPTADLDATVYEQVNGVTVQTIPLVLSGSSGSVPGDLNTSFSATTFPYTFTARVIPSNPGIAPTGIQFSCPAAGSGTNFTIFSGSVSAIPALSPWSLLWMTALLAMTGLVALRRRRSRIGRSAAPCGPLGA